MNKKIGEMRLFSKPNTSASRASYLMHSYEQYANSNLASLGATTWYEPRGHVILGATILAPISLRSELLHVTNLETYKRRGPST